MAVCPQCGNSLDQDFGVVSCSQCAAVLFVDMEGNVHFSGNESNQNSEQNYSEPSTSDQSAQYNDYSEQPAQQEYQPIEQSNYEAPAEEVAEYISPEPEPSSSESMEVSEGELIEEEVEASTDENPLDLGPAPVAPNDFSDVESFANSELAVGPLSYSVIIEDINMKETRAELKEALTDEKFQWDAAELIRNIQGGRLILKDLNPVKASVLIHRLRDLKVKISWRQNIYG